MEFYFVIPTINGEIFGEPYITFSLNYNFKEEVTIYKISFEINNCYIEEIK